MNAMLFKKALVCLTLAIPFVNSSSYCMNINSDSDDGKRSSSINDESDKNIRNSQSINSRSINFVNETNREIPQVGFNSSTQIGSRLIKGKNISMGVSGQNNIKKGQLFIDGAPKEVNYSDGNTPTKEGNDTPGIEFTGETLGEKLAKRKQTKQKGGLMFPAAKPSKEKPMEIQRAEEFTLWKQEQPIFEWKIDKQKYTDDNIYSNIELDSVLDSIYELNRAIAEKNIGVSSQDGSISVSSENGEWILDAALLISKFSEIDDRDLVAVFDGLFDVVFNTSGTLRFMNEKILPDLSDPDLAKEMIEALRELVKDEKQKSIILDKYLKIKEQQKGNKLDLSDSQDYKTRFETAFDLLEKQLSGTVTEDPLASICNEQLDDCANLLNYIKKFLEDDKKDGSKESFDALKQFIEEKKLGLMQVNNIISTLNDIYQLSL